MENRKDYEKLLGERLEDAYMREDFVPVMSREEFHRLIQTAEKKKRARRALMSFAVVCVALCLVWGGLMAGMTMRESASAGRDDESRTMQQGDSMVIGSGVSEDDENVGVSTKTYTNIDDIPEDIRNEICFLDSDEFELEKVKVMDNYKSNIYVLYYSVYGDGKSRIEITEKKMRDGEQGQVTFLHSADVTYKIKGIDVYVTDSDKGDMHCFQYGDTLFLVSFVSDKEISKEAVIEGLFEY